MTAGRRRSVPLACMALAVAALAAPLAVQLPARIVYNPSASVARGWYRIGPVRGPGSLHSGSIVLARLPAGVAAFAGQRGYLPGGVPILKRVGAVAPQSVCVCNHLVRIDGDTVATIRTHDGAHRPMPAWASCRPLVHGELFLLSSTNPASFDSRYFGPIDASAVLGVAYPLWTWEAP
jgi:conjugative transfer signal peptidase TraF